MAKAASKKRNNRADPLSKKGKEPKTEKETKVKSPKKEKDPKQSHLYTDDNPETTLHGTGFKDAATANKTSTFPRCAFYVVFGAQAATGISHSASCPWP